MIKRACVVGAMVGSLALVSTAHSRESPAELALPDGFEVLGSDDAGSITTGQIYARVVPKAPIVVMLQGSGCDSVWQKNDGTMVPLAAQNLPALLAPDRTVMIVDKPAVAVGTNQPCGADFTLETWAAHLGQAISSVREEGEYEGSIALIGISEGAVTAAHLAATRSDISHVVFISATGCLLVDDMVANAARQAERSDQQDGLETFDRIEQASSAAQSSVELVFAEGTPLDDRVWGHPVAYWRTFGTACPANDLAKTDASVFLAFGTSDEQIIAAGVEEIVARRVMAGKPIEVRRVGQGGHILNRPGDSNPSANLVAVMRDAIEWLKSPPSR